MRFGSLFSGVGGMDIGLERAGLTCAWQVEIDARCRSVLARHWPGVTRYEDVRDVGSDTLAPVDLVCGGFPCQDISVAGRRAGLDGARSGLWHEFRRIVDELRPAWVLVENVPGLRSSAGGRDLAAIVRGLAQLGYVGAWRSLDARHFGVGQRRERLFLLACRDTGAGCPAEILAIPEGLSGYPAPGREAGEGVTGFAQAGTLDARTTAGGFPGTDGAASGHVVAIAFVLRGREDGGTAEMANDDTAFALRGSQGGGDKAHVLTPLHYTHDYNQDRIYDATGIAPAHTANDSNRSRNVYGADVAVPRRLTPRECERLMGWPDDWTRYAADGTEIADGPRYRMCGNGVVASVAEWIGRRLRAEITVEAS